MPDAPRPARHPPARRQRRRHPADGDAPADPLRRGRQGTGAGLRRKRGLAAQSLYAAVGLAVAALRKIVSFLEHKRQDAQGCWYVPRKPRPGSNDLALGEGGGYTNDDDWPPDDEDQPPDDA